LQAKRFSPDIQCPTVDFAISTLEAVVELQEARIRDGSRVLLEMLSSCESFMKTLKRDLFKH